MNKILANTRYAVFITAIASILGALLLMFQGSIEMVRTIIDVVINGTKLKLTIVEILTAVDEFFSELFSWLSAMVSMNYLLMKI